MLGINEENLRVVRQLYQCETISRDRTVTMTAPTKTIKALDGLMTGLKTHLKTGRPITPEVIRGYFNGAIPLTPHQPELVLEFPQGRTIVPRSPRQKRFLQMLRKDPLVVATGPAGTGKTFLAVCYAVHRLLCHEVERVVLTRPAIEAGEKRGDLPRGVRQKISPYLAPFYDSLTVLFTRDEINDMINNSLIEICPLAYMRGRTLNNAFVVLDEAQNCLFSQLKMLLTRLGEGSQMVITGDTTQIDLPRPVQSGLIHLRKVLRRTRGVRFIEFNHRDVSRHPLVGRIIRAFQHYEKTD